MSYLWNDGITDPTYLATQPGTYSVTVNNPCGSASSQMTISADSCVTCSLRIPNVFTPNADGMNDVLLVECVQTTSTLTVFNRWGEKVFSSDRPDTQGWDGRTFDGQLVPSGVYYYTLDPESDGESMRGYVQVLR